MGGWGDTTPPPRAVSQTARAGLIGAGPEPSRPYPTSVISYLTPPPRGVTRTANKRGVGWESQCHVTGLGLRFSTRRRAVHTAQTPSRKATTRPRGDANTGGSASPPLEVCMIIHTSNRGLTGKSQCRRHWPPSAPARGLPKTGQAAHRAASSPFSVDRGAHRRGTAMGPCSPPRHWLHEVLAGAGRRGRGRAVQGVVWGVLRGARLCAGEREIRCP